MDKLNMLILAAPVRTAYLQVLRTSDTRDLHAPQSQSEIVLH